MKTGLIDVGGGLRDIYGAGVLDRCMEDGVRFDWCCGVSAGSANISSFISHQLGRAFRFYYDFSFRKEYMSAENYFKTGSYFDLGYVYGTLSRSDGESPLDYEALAADPAAFEIVATEAESGRAVYFDKSDLKPDNYEALMASSAIPVVCKPVSIGGVRYYDGAISDPVPIRRALEAGCERIVLILTLPTDTVRNSVRDDALAAVLRRTHPMAAHGLRLRAKRYNDAVKQAFEMQREGRLLIVAPSDITGVDTTKKSKEALLRLYTRGCIDGGRIKEFLDRDQSL